MKIATLITFLSFAFTGLSQAGNCRFSISENLNYFERNHAQELSVFKSLVFKINGVEIKATDTIDIIVPVNKTGFDTAYYSYVYLDGKTHNEWFICKLRDKEYYKISVCTCCGIFLIIPEHPERGYVQFVNDTKEEMLGSSGGYEFEKLKEQAGTDFIYSSIL